MTCIDTPSKRRRSATVAAGLALSALLLLATGLGTARADDHDRDHRGWERQENHHRSHWTGGYYRAPPVVYSREGGYYARPAPPPVYYGSGIGVTLPGLNFNFR